MENLKKDAKVITNEERLSLLQPTTSDLNYVTIAKQILTGLIRLGYVHVPLKFTHIIGKKNEIEWVSKSYDPKASWCRDYITYRKLALDIKLVTVVEYGPPLYGNPTLIYRPNEKELLESLLTVSVWVRNLLAEGIEPNPGPRTNKKTTNNIKRNNKAKKPVRPRFTNNTNRAQTVQHQHKIARLDYEEALSDFNNAGGPIVSGEFRFTDIYDIDPAILSRSIQFAQYMFDIYQYAKVISCTVEHIFDNLEQHAMEVACFHSNVPLLSSLGTRGQLESQEATALMVTRKVMSEQYGKKSQVRLS